MIAFVHGPVAAVGLDSAVVQVGGIGLQVMCTPGTLAGLRVGQPVQLATSMVVREESLTLFGFVDDEERGLFELLQTASGVGPKLAQAMLAVHGPDELRRAVTSEDLVALTKVPGIGRKGAQRIVLELKDRVGGPAASGGTPTVSGRAKANGWREQVHGALLGLGWSAREAESALDAVADQAADQAADEAAGQATDGAGDEPDVPSLLRAALRTLSKA